MGSRSCAPRLITAVTVVGGTLTIAGQPASAASFEVTTLDDVVDADDGVLSLREAMTAANNTADADTITFADGLIGQIEMTTRLGVGGGGDMNIVGPGADILSIKSSQEVFYVYNAVGFGLSGVTVSSSLDAAVIVIAEADITLGNVSLSGSGTNGLRASQIGDLAISGSNVSANGADGIVVQGVATLTVTDSLITGNGGFGVSVDGADDVVLSLVTASSNDIDGISIDSVAANLSIDSVTADGNSRTGIAVDDVGGNGSVTGVGASENGGLGIDIFDVQGTLTVAGVTTTANDLDGGLYLIDVAGDVSVTGVVSEKNGGSGVGIRNIGGNLTVVDVVSSENGGNGLVAESEADVVVSRVVASDNAGNGASLLAFAGSVVASDVAVANNFDVGLYLAGGGGETVTVSDTTVSGSVVGVRSSYNDADVAMSRVTVTDSVEEGVRLFGGSTSLTDVEITGAGTIALYVDVDGDDGESATLDRVTIAESSAGAIVLDGNGPVSILNSTISGNDPQASGAVITFDEHVVDIRHSTISGNNTNETATGVFDAAPADLTIEHSVLAENGGARVFVAAPSADLAHIENSLVPTGLGITGTNVESDVALLGPLADNGGLTRTMLPLEGSPAIDAGNPLFVGPPLVDQRASARVVDVIDIGAVEIQPQSVVTSTEPARFVDTRPVGDTIDDRYRAEGKREAESEYRVVVTDRGDVPVDAKAVVVNITAVAAEGVGFVTVHPCLDERPLASSLNYTPGVNLANEVIAPVSADGEICLYTSQPAHLLVDVTGYVEATSPVVPLAPSRYLDTRLTGQTFDEMSQRDGPTSAEGTVTLQVGGRGEVPADAAAVIVNVTAVGPDQTGFVTVHPCADAPPNASSLNYVAGVNRANELIASLNSDGEICLFTSSSVGLLADVVGFIPSGTALDPVAPARFLDTRTVGETVDGKSQGEGKRQAASRYELQIGGRDEVPDEATAVVVNVTAVGGEGTGFVTVHPCVPVRPNASSLNFVEGVNSANELIALLDADGTICLYTSEETHLLVDVVGYLD